MIDLSIVILSYNTKELLRECILSIKKNLPDTASFELIVIDNASPDGSAKMVKEEFPDVTLVANKKNIGYTRGNNLGVVKSGGRYVLFLNADTLIPKGTPETMLRFMEENEDAGAATCKVVLPNGELDDSCHRGFPTPWRAFCHFSGLAKLFSKSRVFAGYSLGWFPPEKTHEIDSCSGAFMIIRRKAGEEIDWWDEDFFWYGDDLDFCYRLKEKNWKVYFVPTVKILHYKGASSGIKETTEQITTATRKTRLMATNARFEAMKIFYRKHYQDKYPKIITGLVILGINFKRWWTLKSF